MLICNADMDNADMDNADMDNADMETKKVPYAISGIGDLSLLGD